jgi:hypothetical protein
MKTLLVLALAAIAAAPLVGCDTPQGQNAAGGALLGGATGAILGGAITGRPGGALVGAATGAAAGAIIGSAATPPGPGYHCAEWYYDYYGNRVCRNWY